MQNAKRYAQITDNKKKLPCAFPKNTEYICDLDSTKITSQYTMVRSQAKYLSKIWVPTLLMAH